MRISNWFLSSSRFALIAAVTVIGGGAPVRAQDDILLPPPTEVPDAIVIEDGVAPEPTGTMAPVEDTPEAAAAAQDSFDDILTKMDQGAPAVPAGAAEVVPGATPPAEGALASPTEVGEVPALPPNATADEDLFFDADTLVPTGEMGAGAPRKVNPALQPASKLIIVKKDYTPNSREAQLVAAERAVVLGHYDAALEMYDALYAKNKRDPNILMGRAIALQKLGRDDEAANAYEELLDIRPENKQAQVNLAGLMGGRYPAVALQRLKELQAEDPSNVAILGQMAVLTANLGQYDEAIKYLGMATSMEPNNASHLFNMGVIADRIGKKDDAINYYEQALEIDAINGGGKSIPRDAVFERLARLR